MPDPFTQFGATLGVIVRHGMPTVMEAVAACKQGEGTPAQQKIVVDLLLAVAGHN